MKNLIYIIGVVCLITSCSEKYRKIDKDDVTVSSKRVDSVASKSVTPVRLRDSMLKKGYKFFDVIDEKTKDTVIMQQYFVVFLKKGSAKSGDDKRMKRLQQEHLDYLDEMYNQGHADISGPYGDVGEFMGMTIYSVPTFEVADSLAKADPIVKEGFLDIEVHPWWAPKGSMLR